MTQHVTEQNFEQAVLNAERPVLVDFWAEWCGPCQALGPVLDEVSTDFAGKADVVKINVDESPSIAQRYGVRGIPTLMVFKDGQATETTTGARPKPAVAALLNKHLQ